MSEPQVEAIIDVAKQIAEAKGITVREAEIAMANVQVQELLGIVKDLAPAGGDLRDQVRELADAQTVILARLGQLQEHVNQLRHGLDAQEIQISSTMDAAQTCISNLSELSKAVAEIAGRLPNG